MRARPECVSSAPVLETRWITVRRDRYRLDGSRDAIDYYVTDTADIALVVPLTPRGRFVLVRQWKLPIGRWSLEFPAGAIGTGSPLANAKREVRRVREPAPDSIEQACRLTTVELGRPQLIAAIRRGRVHSAGTLAALALLQAR